MDVGNASSDPSSSEGRPGQYGDARGEEEDEADKIYAAVDERLATRHKKRKAAREETEAKKQGLEGKISDQFKDLKEKLGDVTEKEWAALPDVGDRSLKFKQQRRQEVYTPLVDTMLADQAKRMGSSNTDSSIGGRSAGGAGDDDDGLTTVVGGLASARNKVITQTLSSISDNVGGQTVVDPKGYMTQLR